MAHPATPPAADTETDTRPLWVVTRHAGAAAWVQARLGQPVCVIPHLHPDAIEPGARYHGVFPLHLAAAICQAGAECWAIAVEMPPALRGQELDAAQLDALGARLVRYAVRERADAHEADLDARTGEAAQP